MEHRGSNPNLQCHKLPCCHYTMDHILKVGASVGIRTLINCLQGSGTTVMLQKHVGVRGGTRTRKTCVLSAVPMPIRLHGHLVGVEGVEPSPRGPRPRILPLYDTPMMKQAVFLLSGGLFKNSLFQMRILRLNRTVFGDLKGS